MESVDREPLEPPRTNQQVENAAIRFVMAHEERAGRTPEDTRHKGALADLVSGDRIIEVKAAGTSSRGYDLWLEPPQFKAAREHPDRFWIYLVENVRQGDPSKFRLLQIGGDQLRSLLEKAKPRHYYTVPLSVTVHDALSAAPKD